MFGFMYRLFGPGVLGFYGPHLRVYPRLEPLGFIGPVIGLLIMLGLLALIVVALVRLLRGRPARVAGQAALDPLSIAKSRLASGQITTEQYEQIKQRLQQ
jgi:uncharacterized membrane protein